MTLCIIIKKRKPNWISVPSPKLSPMRTKTYLQELTNLQDLFYVCIYR